jgi:hypothetical protein
VRKNLLYYSYQVILGAFLSFFLSFAEKGNMPGAHNIPGLL